MIEPVRGSAMISEMTPTLDHNIYVFCCSPISTLPVKAANAALSIFMEDEGASLILKLSQAIEHGFDTTMQMRRIVLEVNSALDGVGLTAAVATALAAKAIPCNVVAAFHHDHIFVPSQLADQALAILTALQESSPVA